MESGAPGEPGDGEVTRSTRIEDGLDVRRRRHRRAQSSTGATMRKAPSGSGASLTVRPSRAQNSRTSSVGASPRRCASASTNGVLVRAAGEADPGLRAHGAVHAVGADDVARCGRRRRRRTSPSRPSASCVTVASTLGLITSPPSSTTPVEQQPLGVVLGAAACTDRPLGEGAEVDGDEHLLRAVPDRESGRLDAFLDHPAGHVEPLEHFQGAGVDSAGA